MSFGATVPKSLPRLSDVPSVLLRLLRLSDVRLSQSADAPAATARFGQRFRTFLRGSSPSPHSSGPEAPENKNTTSYKTTNSLPFRLAG